MKKIIIFRIFHVLILSQEATTECVQPNVGVNHERWRQGIQTKREATVQRAKRTTPSPDWSGNKDSRVMMPRENPYLVLVYRCYQGESDTRGILQSW